MKLFKALIFKQPKYISNKRVKYTCLIPFLKFKTHLKEEKKC